jgi:DNA-binding IclR family transcriptional regulator
MLAYLSAEEQKRRGVSVANRARLARVRSAGLYAVLRGAYKDAWSVSSAIKNNHGYPVAFVAVAGPMSRYHEGLFADVGSRVRAVARDISTQLGCLTADLAEYRAPLDDIPVFSADDASTPASG